VSRSTIEIIAMEGTTYWHTATLGLMTMQDKPGQHSLGFPLHESPEAMQEASHVKELQCPLQQSESPLQSNPSCLQPPPLVLDEVVDPLVTVLVAALLTVVVVLPPMPLLPFEPPHPDAPPTPVAPPGPVVVGLRHASPQWLQEDVGSPSTSAARSAHVATAEHEVAHES
jgi:hypothetical protein